MKLEIQIENVVAEKQNCFFIAVQMDYKDALTPSQKFRTDLAPPSNRPKYQRNLFTFNTVIAQQTLRFGLMACPDSSEDSVSKSSLVGTTSMTINLSRLRQLPPGGQLKVLHFSNKHKEVGQFQCKITFSQSIKQTLKQSKAQVQQLKPLQFNPLLSRVLFSEEAAKDQLRMQNNIKQLQKQARDLYASFKGLKGQEQTLQKLYSNLLKDEEQFKNQIQMNQKISEKISLKITQRQSLQALKLQIDMLRNSEEGKGLLLQKLEYFQQRINLQVQQYQRLADKYQKIKYVIKARIERAQNYAQKLKGKELQQFQLQRNRQIFKKYEDIQYEFNCNQHIIQQLVNKTHSNELTGEQAALILSQVNFKLKMEEISGGHVEQDKMVELIEKEAGTMPKISDKEVGEEQKLVLGIKLNALEQEILIVRGKIKQALGKKHLQQSYVKRL